MLTKDEVLKLIEKTAKGSVDHKLMLALAYVESSFDPWDIRYEPGYPYLKDAAVHAIKQGISLETEKMLQRSSWGLFQIMGCGLREIGFSDNLTKMTIPEVSVVWGIEFFKKRSISRYTEIEDQIAAHNAGSVRKDEHGNYKPASTELYVDKVLKAYKEL